MKIAQVASNFFEEKKKKERGRGGMFGVLRKGCKKQTSFSPFFHSSYFTLSSHILNFFFLLVVSVSNGFSLPTRRRKRGETERPINTQPSLQKTKKTLRRKGGETDSSPKM
jgi:hypothetical protein